VSNLFDPISPEVTEEIFQVLLSTGNFRLERIVSAGQATPPREWCDQDTHEWVALLSGGARLRFEDEAEPRVLSPGGAIQISRFITNISICYAKWLNHSLLISNPIPNLHAKNRPGKPWIVLLSLPVPATPGPAPLALF
jgi:cupin 2 domain-containing protein